MDVYCEHCGEEFDINNKRNKKVSAHNKITKMAQCPNCGRKVFYDVVQKYAPSQEELQRIADKFFNQEI